MTEQSLAFTRGLSLPDTFTEGQPFAYSGMAGENLFRQDWCGVLTGIPGEIRFICDTDASCCLLRFTERKSGYDVVLPDLIAADGGAILVTFANAQTIVGRSDTQPAIRLENEAYTPGCRTLCDGRYAVSLAVRQASDGYVFALCRRSDASAVETDARNALRLDCAALANAVLDWYQTCPPCPDPHFEKLWYKCLSVNRVNVFSPQEGSAHPFTTPNRTTRFDAPVRDACFHMVSMAHYAPELAGEVLLAVLDRRHEDGFIPYGLQLSGSTVAIPYPPLLCTAVWNLFEITGDYALLEEAAEPLRRHLEWTSEKRRSPNGLMVYAPDPNRCEARGTDASARPGADEPIESVDLSVFTALDLMCMHRMYMTLGDHASALRMEQQHFELAERINTRLWDEQTRCYFDRTFGGAYRRILTSASFLPLYAGICDPRQAHCLVTHLAPLLARAYPISSVTDENGERPDRIQWRGSIALHHNYFIYVGLQRYGFGKYASELRRKTLEGVDKLFRETGRIFEYYDPYGGIPTRDAADLNHTANFIQMFLCG